MPKESHFLVHYKVGWFRWGYAVMNAETGEVTGVAKVWGFTEPGARDALVKAFNRITAREGAETIEIPGAKPIKVKFVMTETGIQTHVVSE